MARYGKSPSGNPLTKYVNMYQSPEERREKYHFARCVLTCSVDTSAHVRSWHWTKIKLLVVQRLTNKRDIRRWQAYCDERRVYYNTEF